MQLHNTEITLKGRLFPFLGLWDIFAKRKGDIIVFCMTCKATQIGGEGPLFALLFAIVHSCQWNWGNIVCPHYIQGTEGPSYWTIKNMIKVRIILVFKIIAHVNWLCSKNPKGLLYCDHIYSVCVFPHCYQMQGGAVIDWRHVNEIISCE